MAGTRTCVSARWSARVTVGRGGSESGWTAESAAMVGKLAVLILAVSVARSTSDAMRRADNADTMRIVRGKLSCVLP